MSLYRVSAWIKKYKLKKSANGNNVIRRGRGFHLG